VDQHNSPSLSATSNPLTSLPESLQAGNLFCLWRRMPDGKKKPIQPLTGRAAHTNQPAEFSSFAVAARAFQNKTYSNIAGVGRLMRHDYDSVYSIDVDDVITNSLLAPFALDLIAQANSYAEVTPSGTGIRIFGRGPVPESLWGKCSTKIWEKTSQPEGIEVQLFLQGQYITLTGNQIAGTRDTLTEDPAFLDYLLRLNPDKISHYFPSTSNEAAFCLRPPARTGRHGSRLDQDPNAEPSVIESNSNANANFRQTNSRIKHMCDTSPVFAGNWNHDSGKDKSNSEYQRDLVVHFYVRYQPSRPNIEFMLSRWCKRWAVQYKPHRLDSWMLDAQAAFQKSGRLSFRAHETQRQRIYRAGKRNPQPTTPQPVIISDTHSTPRLGYGGRTKQILELVSKGLSQRAIAKSLGISHRAVRTTLKRNHTHTTKTPVIISDTCSTPLTEGVDQVAELVGCEPYPTEEFDYPECHYNDYEETEYPLDPQPDWRDEGELGNKVAAEPDLEPTPCVVPVGPVQGPETNDLVEYQDDHHKWKVIHDYNDLTDGDDRGLRKCWKLDRKFGMSIHSKRTFDGWKTAFLALPKLIAMAWHSCVMATDDAAVRRRIEAEQPGHDTLVLQNFIQGCTELIAEGFPDEHLRSYWSERLRVHLELHPESLSVADRLRREYDDWCDKQRRRFQ
jgi:hypothetical protein